MFLNQQTSAGEECTCMIKRGMGMGRVQGLRREKGWKNGSKNLTKMFITDFLTCILTLSPPVVFPTKLPRTPDVFGKVSRIYVHYLIAIFKEKEAFL